MSSVMRSFRLMLFSGNQSKTKKPA